MKYYSINRHSPPVDFKEATIKGQAPDKGLYFPQTIPRINKETIMEIEHLPMEEIAFRVIKPYVGETIPDEKLFQIVSETINFPVPLVEVKKGIFSLELFHGNTLAFKDIGARFMSRCLGYFVRDVNRKITVLVATSGDTGAAVADGFYDIEGVEVVILYPSGKVSLVQEKQLTTLGKNIHAIEVDGTFDDCQKLVKMAFADQTLKDSLLLTSANSINVARWLPQQFFYFFAYRQWQNKNEPPVICVPSGNFGNICAGLLAKKSGLPLGHFIAACNSNDVVPRFMENGIYEPKDTFATISNAMDVGNPSNFVRILEMVDNQLPVLKDMLSAYRISEEETKKTIGDVYNSCNYLLDPHGAVAFTALQHYLRSHPGQQGVFMETAHPVKFYNVIEPLLNMEIDQPELIKAIMSREKKARFINADFEALRAFLLAL